MKKESIAPLAFDISQETAAWMNNGGPRDIQSRTFGLTHIIDEYGTASHPRLQPLLQGRLNELKTAVEAMVMDFHAGQSFLPHPAPIAAEARFLEPLEHSYPQAGKPKSRNAMQVLDELGETLEACRECVEFARIHDAKPFHLTRAEEELRNLYTYAERVQPVAQRAFDMYEKQPSPHKK